MMKGRGRVYLVGAGPGDPDLLTVKALRLIQSADVIVFDRLVSKGILELAGSQTRMIDVGKRPQHHPVSQAEIQRILIELADEGGTIVRLKGGDPFLFGRGGEELLDLLSHGIVVDVVPGITSAQGCAAAAGLPLTHRGVASGIRYITGHCRADMDLDFDWQGLADADTTLVVYMGRANIGSIAERLMAHGRAAQTPVLAVNNGTRIGEHHTVARLDEIAAVISKANPSGPVLFVIGEVVALATRSQEVALAQLDTRIARHA